VQRKINNLLERGLYGQALRIREQTLKRNPEWTLRPGEEKLWILEGSQALEHRQAKRAEAAFQRALALAPTGGAWLWLARLRLEEQQPQRALALLEEAFDSGQLTPEYAGGYLKLLLLQGQEQQVRRLLREQPQRFQPQQIHWAAGVLNLLEGNATQARRQFEQMAAPANPGDHCAVWRALGLRETGHLKAAAAALEESEHPACAALALDLAARADLSPASVPPNLRKLAPSPERVKGQQLLYHLRHEQFHLAADLLLIEERELLAMMPELKTLRRPLLLLAGQEALERGRVAQAIRCWRPIVERPAFDPDLALRLYPLLEPSDDKEETALAERLAGGLQAWVRRSANDAPADWPESLLSTTLARLQCWQADQLMRLGKLFPARRCIEQANQLAPDLPDVIGRRGMVTCLSGSIDVGIPLLWQALEAGCRSQGVYEVLEEILLDNDRQEDWERLKREYGAKFGDEAPPMLDQDGVHPTWMQALCEGDVMMMGGLLRSLPSTTGGGLKALQIFLDHVAGERVGKGSNEITFNLRKVVLRLPEVSQAWDALLATLPPLEQVKALTALLAAITRFCRRNAKGLASEIAKRQGQLEAHAAARDTPEADPAVRGLLLLHGLRLKRGESPEPQARLLLRGTARPERLLPLALLDLRLFCPTGPWRGLVAEQQRQDPENPLLTLALATMERNSSTAYRALSAKAFEQARRQQDREALAACRREEAFMDRTNPRKKQLLFGNLDFGALFQRMADEMGLIDLDDDEDDDEDGGEEPPPPPTRRRRTFMDL
jgi:hypothetical protein